MIKAGLGKQMPITVGHEALTIAMIQSSQPVTSTIKKTSWLLSGSQPMYQTTLSNTGFPNPHHGAM